MTYEFEAVLFGYYGFGNLGDELLARAILSLYEKNGISGERIAILSADPEKSSAYLGIHSVDRWDVLGVWNLLRKSRTLLLGGGGLFQDSTSIRSCFYYWGVIRMALLAGCRVWMFGQSIGPFNSKLARFLARDGIGRCKVRVVRDRPSMDILIDWGQNAHMVPDPVLGLAPDRTETSEGKYLLVNIRPWVDPDIPEKVFSCALEISSRERIPLRIVAMAPEDAKLAQHYISLKGIRNMEIEKAWDWKDVSRIWKGAKFAFGMRLHFCVLSSLSGIPCLAVPYDPKVEGFCSSHAMSMWDMQNYPDLKTLQGEPSQGMLLAECRAIEEIFSRSLKEVGDLQ